MEYLGCTCHCSIHLYTCCCCFQYKCHPSTSITGIASLHFNHWYSFPFNICDIRISGKIVQNCWLKSYQVRLTFLLTRTSSGTLIHVFHGTEATSLILAPLFSQTVLLMSHPVHRLPSVEVCLPFYWGYVLLFY